MPSGRGLIAQFKSPIRARRSTTPYRFHVSVKQHACLLDLVRRTAKPDCVFYVLPSYRDFEKVRGDAPALLTDTWFVRVQDLAALAAGGSAGRRSASGRAIPTSPYRGRFEVTGGPCAPMHRWHVVPPASAHARPPAEDAVPPNDYRDLAALIERTGRDGLVTFSEIADWLRSASEPQVARRPRLPGLGVLYMI